MVERIEQIAELLRKQATGALSAPEAKELQAWAEEKEENAALLQQVSTSDYVLGKLKAYRAMETPPPDQLPQLRRVMGVKRPFIQSFYRWLPYVAALCLIVGAGALYFWQNSDTVDNKKSVITANEILPGGNKATLTLADGRTIDLNTEQRGIVVDGKTLRYADGSHVFASGSKERLASSDFPAYASLQTPRGGTYSVTLPDGSRVWLNAASSLKYPTHFDAAKRVVELQGEAYFEIKALYKSDEKGLQSQKVPFLVKTREQTVAVLGTQFNITAYANEPVVETTLIEGRVQVMNAASQASYLLKPNMQSRVQGKQTTLHAATDPTRAAAWRNGLIVLSDADLPTVIRALERWYDVQFEGIDLPGNMHMNGEVPRDVPLATVLRALESNTGIHFQVTGRRVLMTK